MSALSTKIHAFLTDDIIRVLNNKGIYTIFQFVREDTHVLCKLTKLSFKAVLIVKNHVVRKNSAVTCNALEYYQSILKKTAIISTSYTELDALLGGGFYTGIAYEVCSKAIYLTTAFLHKFIAAFVTKHSGTQKVYYCDARFGLHAAQFSPVVAEHVFVHQHSDDIFKLIDAMYVLKEGLATRAIKTRIVIIDAISAVQFQTNRHEKYNMLLNCLINIVRLIMVEYHVCFIITNLINYAENGDERMEEVMGGKYWRSLCKIRLSVKQIDEDPNANFRFCVVKNTSGLTGQECKIKL